MLYTGGLTVTQIAKKLSRCRSTVSNVVLKFKSTGSHQKKKDRDQRRSCRFAIKESWRD